MIQSEQATQRALAVHAEASSRQREMELLRLMRKVDKYLEAHKEIIIRADLRREIRAAVYVKRKANGLQQEPKR